MNAATENRMYGVGTGLAVTGLLLLVLLRAVEWAAWGGVVLGLAGALVIFELVVGAVRRGALGAVGAGQMAASGAVIALFAGSAWTYLY